MSRPESGATRVTPPAPAGAHRWIPALLGAGLLAVGGGPSTAGSGWLAVGPAPLVAQLPDDDTARRDRLDLLLNTLAADSMEGRRAGTAGERRARDVLVAELRRYGVEPAGEDGYLQAVPLVRVEGRRGPRWTVPPAGTDLDTIPEADRRTAWNVLGLVPGADPELAREVVIVGSHYDHVGVGRPVDGDSIYNGADDDASGTAAALEIARSLATGEPPGRSVLIGLFTAEEMGILGARWFLEHPTVDVERLVADLQIEMIGRPDSLAGGPGRAWLTGYERSTMGDLLAAQGSPIVPDPRPEQRFFFRSDNLPFAMAGIPAHTLSSYNLHGEYHTPDDEADLADPDHMAAVVEAAVAMVRGLASGPRPEWKEGGRPAR